MKPKHRLLLLLCIAAVLGACGAPQSKKDPARLDSRRRTSLDHFGTVCFASVYDDFNSPAAEKRFDDAWREIYGMLSDLENAVSVDLPESDLSRFNGIHSGQTVRVRPVTAEVVALAQEMYRFTDGVFNPAVANLVDLWGFSPRFRRKDGGAAMPYDRPRNADGGFDPPDRRYVIAFQGLSDFSGVLLSGDPTSGYSLAKNVPDAEVDGVPYPLKIDLGGIAKGFAADKAAAILKNHGYEYGYANIGLSSLKLLQRNVSDKGAPAKFMWAVGMVSPDRKTEDYLTVYGKDTGVSTSGTYDLHYAVAGREYSHLIDPRTGEPTLSDIVFVTILGENAGRDDALSTALCIMGKGEARGFLDTRLKDYRVACLARSGSGLELVTNMSPKDYRLQP